MGPFIQVFLAVLIVVILFIIAMVLYNKELLNAVRQTSTIQKSVPVFSGIVDFANTTNVSFDTLNPNAPNYLNLGQSINQLPGAAYSYNFWLYIDNTDSKKPIFNTPTDATNQSQLFTDSGLYSKPNIANGDDLPFILFLRGSNRILKYSNLCKRLANSPGNIPGYTDQSSNDMKTDILVKSPLVKLEHNGQVLTVEFNTLAYPDAVKTGSRNTCVEINNDWYYINQYKVGLKGIANTSTPSEELSKQWFMVTIVLQDTYPSDPLPLRNKIRSQIYINGSLELDKYVVGNLADQTNSSASPLRSSQGNLYINPKLADSINNGGDLSMTKENNANLNNNPNKFMMADLTYYNYALQPSDVLKLFNVKHNTNYAPILSQLTGQSITDTSYLTTNSTITNPQTIKSNLLG